jgi:4-hydroxy-tetrahydrodipicolinate reductase
MRIALIGNGKTGGAFRELAQTRHEVSVFSSRLPCTRKDLEAADAAVVFVPAAGLADLLPLLRELRRPVVCGTTGFEFDKLSGVASPWIVASNFSIGMNATFLMAKLLARLPAFAPARFHVHEVHHVTKKDAPSGTALRLQSLLPAGSTISADRLGDAKGLHTLKVDLPGETIRLEHEAHDRSVFAAGALHALEQLIPGLPTGVHHFENLLETSLRKELFRA